MIMAYATIAAKPEKMYIFKGFFLNQKMAMIPAKIIPGNHQ